jgi:hypothetical protein
MRAFPHQHSKKMQLRHGKFVLSAILWCFVATVLVFGSSDSHSNEECYASAGQDSNLYIAVKLDEYQVLDNSVPVIVV